MKTYIINVSIKRHPERPQYLQAVKNKEVEKMQDTLINLFVLLSRTNYEIRIYKRLLNSKELEAPRETQERLKKLLKLRNELKEILGIPEFETEIKQIP